MWFELRKRLVCFFLVALGASLVTLAYMNKLGLYGEIIIGTAVIFVTMAAGSALWSRRGDESLVRRPQPEVEMEIEEDEELKEEILRILFPGTVVDEESALFKASNGLEGQPDADGFTCAICLEPFESGDLVVSGASCTHTFHRPCVLQWLMKKRRRSTDKHNSCPTCRSPMWTDEEYEKAEAAATAARDNESNKEQQNDPTREENDRTREQNDQITENVQTQNE